MKLRYFLRGLGAGIVFTVLVLGISDGNPEKEVLTDNEIIARARELGMVTKDEKLDESLSQIMDNQTADKEKETTDQKDEQAGADTTEQSEEEKDTSGEEPKDEDTGKETIIPEPLEKEETEVSYKVTISPGMTSKQVSAALKKLGIIDNAEEFDAYLCDNGYSSEIRVGTYTIEGKPDYSELARIIAAKE